MEDDRQEVTFSSDRPLKDPKDDVLGYSEFAKGLAAALDQMAPQEGFVVAIHGTWGSGKTTVVNFLCHYLEESSSSFTVVKFNPWWFQNREQLTRMFFDQLLVAAGKDEKLNELRAQLADFGDAISDLPLPWVGLAGVGKFLRPKAKDLSALKRELGSALEEAGKRFLILIDDIDRLHANETRQMFRLIKAVADLPGITYLVAFDRDVVAQMLDQDQEGHGGDFLEKIVQVAFELPAPQGNAVHDLVLSRFEQLLAKTPETLFDKHHFANLYWKGIAHFVRTPRDATRLMNYMRLTYPTVEGEVNPVDFLGIEALRVFCPHIYHIIRGHPDAFTRGELADEFRLGINQNDSEAFKAYHKAWLDEMPAEDRNATRELMLELFPRLASVWQNMGYGPDWDQTWRRQLRVCHSDILPVYFHLALPPGSISASEMREIIEDGHDADRFVLRLLDLDQNDRLAEFLRLARDHTEELAAAGHTENVLNALFRCGDTLLRTKVARASMTTAPAAWQIHWWTDDLLKTMDYQSRLRVLHQCIEDGKSIALATYTARDLGRQHGRYGGKEREPEEKRLIKADDLDRLEDAVLDLVRTSADDGRLIASADLAMVLYHWFEADGEDATKAWVKQIESHENLVTLLLAFERESTSQTVGNVLSETHHYFDTTHMKTLLDVERLAERSREALEDEELTKGERALLEVYLRDFKRMQEGKDTSTPRDRDEDE